MKPLINKKNPTAAAALVFVILLMSSVVFFISRSHQINSKDEIRILIDRYPNRQSLDVTYRKIAPLVDELHYQIQDDLSNETLVLTPPNPGPDHPKLIFHVVKDETTRALAFLKGDVDVLYDNLALTKIEWLKKRKEIQIIEAPGFNLQYLGFNLKHHELSDLRVRQAIAAALPIDAWVQYKFFHWVEPIPSVELQYNVKKSNQLLDEAGYPRGKDGTRFSLRYFTTPVREGHELGLLIAEALKEIGIRVEISSFETSLFFSKLKQGEFDLFSSRWFRFQEHDPIESLLGGHGKHNFFSYADPEFDRKILASPQFDFNQAKEQIDRDLPLLPLFNWKHGLILPERIQFSSSANAPALDETFRFLSLLRLK